MQAIIDKIDKGLIISELTPERFLRKTNKGENEIYVVNAHNAPHTMREIGRLREIAFRGAGGGTGKDCDIDEYDTMEVPCEQMIVWNPAAEEIIGGYRFILGENVEVRDGVPQIATAHLFRFSEQFVRDYLPVTIELGRSFVSMQYQTTRAGVKALYALDNLWDGLGALIVKYPRIQYLFGKVTMYPDYNRYCRDLLLGFIYRYFPDNEGLVVPIKSIETEALSPRIQAFFGGEDYREDYKTLNQLIRKEGVNIPPLINSYMAVSPTMRMFGTAVNDEFGEVEESGILIKISEIYEEKKARYVESYIRSLNGVEE